MDLYKLSAVKGIEVLQWCVDHNLEPGDLSHLFEIMNRGEQKSLPRLRTPKALPTSSNTSKRDYRALRETKGKSQEEASGEIPVNIQTLRNIEMGRSNARPATLQLLDKYYGVDKQQED